MMTKHEIIEMIESSRSDKKILQLKSMFPVVPKWDQFINHLDYHFNTTPEGPQEESDEWHTIHNGTVAKTGYYFHVRDATSSDKFTFFPECRDVVEFFNEVYSEKTNGGATFLNIVGNGMMVPTHVDDVDSVFWQCQGSTIWEVFLNKEDQGRGIEPIQKVLVEPGDVIVVPRGVFHGLNPHVSRAAIAFRYREGGQ
jgi:mannose-6-phosphate isomerase-like protein (cupin superfamily)